MTIGACGKKEAFQETQAAFRNRVHPRTGKPLWLSQDHIAGWLDFARVRVRGNEADSAGAGEAGGRGCCCSSGG